MRRWLVGGLRSEVSEANGTKQATRPLYAMLCAFILFHYHHQF